ncbi:hypothetical protein D3C80_1254200 [compost metagenome]
MRLAVLVTAFDAGANFIYAAGVVDSAADFSFFGIAGGLVVGCQEGHVVAADAGVTLGGHQFGSAEGHVLVCFQRDAAAAQR